MAWYPLRSRSSLRPLQYTVLLQPGGESCCTSGCLERRESPGVPAAGDPVYTSMLGAVVRAKSRRWRELPLTPQPAEKGGRLAEGAEIGQVMEAEALRRSRLDSEDPLAASREALRGEVSGKAYLSCLFSATWKPSSGNQVRTLRGIETSHRAS